ncbi:GLPGLI family protein [Nonlabens antarcticus]|uniref:GLPGLI family protein n=1 Tax=Nonlabens antarcticus TaxID=392714 RepID=UPI0018919E65|nr:GLPGLI family protein [Nonlabens antarcticus]
MRLITTFSLMLFCWLSYGQLEVQYSVNFQLSKKDKSDSAESIKMRKEFIDPSVDMLNSSVGVLNVCNNQSYFSIIPNQSASIENKPLAKAMIDTSNWLTTKNESGLIDRRYKRIIIADYNKNEWKIESEPKIIAGYTCFKATKFLKFHSDPKLNRELEVWFTPDVPIDSGFMDANNLPGLVLYYNNQQWEFVAQSVKQIKDCDITIPKLDRISFTASNLEASKRMEKRRNRAKN